MDQRLIRIIIMVVLLITLAMICTLLVAYIVRLLYPVLPF